MLSVNDLIDIDYIPAENDISLQLLIDFYETYLCKRIFIFTLRSGAVIKLFFRDATEIFHISGIDHIYKKIPMDGKRFAQGIKDGNINLGTVRAINAAAYKDYEIRIRSMACLDTIIKNCEYLWYPAGKIPDSAIEIKYLLLKGLDGKNIHLGIDTHNEKRPYFSKTLLVTEGNSLNKFIGKADERLRVSKLEIRDKDTDNILLCIERAQAEKNAIEEVRKCADKWLSHVFPVLLSEYFVEFHSKDILEVWLQKIDRDIIQKIRVLYEDIDVAFKMKSDISDIQEWVKLLTDILGGILEDKNCIKRILLSTTDDPKEYQDLLENRVNRIAKNMWKTAIRKYIDTNKADIKRKIDSLDSYWSGKIVAEVIRKFDREEADANIAKYIDTYISSQGEEIIISILVNEIYEQREVVIKKLETTII